MANLHRALFQYRPRPCLHLPPPIVPVPRSPFVNRQASQMRRCYCSINNNKTKAPPFATTNKSAETQKRQYTLWDHMFARHGSICPGVAPNGQYGPMWPHVAPYTHISMYVLYNSTLSYSQRAMSHTDTILHSRNHQCAGRNIGSNRYWR